MGDQQPVRFPLLLSPENRDETSQKDAKLINGFVEMQGQQTLWVYKRPGLLAGSLVAAQQIGLGVYNWNGDIYSVYGSVLYKNGVQVGIGLDTTNGVYTFSVCLGAVPQLFLQNAVSAYTYDSTNGLVAIPQANTLTMNGTVVGGSAVLTNLDNTSGLRVGATITGPQIPANTKIKSIDSPTQVTMDTTANLVAPLVFQGIFEWAGFNTSTWIPLPGTIYSQPYPPPFTITAITPDAAAIQVGATITVPSVSTSAFVTVTGGVTSTSVTLNALPSPYTGMYTWGAQTFSVQNSQTVQGSFSFANTGLSASGFVKGQAYLDGTTYMLTASSYIDGSDFNDLSNWSPLNSIEAMSEPDAGVFLAKQLVYICAMKKYSVENFYDAGNAVGSPLAPATGTKVNYGCRSAGSVQEAEGNLFWIGQTRDGSVQVMKMTNMQATRISTPAVEKLLQNADYTTVYSWVARISGHQFYGVTLKASNLTLVYDSATGLWAQWTDAYGNYLPIVASTVTASQQSLLQHETNGKYYYLDATIYQDDGVTFPVDLYTPNWDAGTRKKKYLKLMDFVGDQTVGGQLFVRHSDDDYQIWSGYRKVDLSRKRAYLVNCGTFRRRAYHIHHLANAPMRLQALELQVDLGEL